MTTQYNNGATSLRFVPGENECDFCGEKAIVQINGARVCFAHVDDGARQAVSPVQRLRELVAKVNDASTTMAELRETITGDMELEGVTRWHVRAKVLNRDTSLRYATEVWVDVADAGEFDMEARREAAALLALKRERPDIHAGDWILGPITACGK